MGGFLEFFFLLTADLCILFKPYHLRLDTKQRSVIFYLFCFNEKFSQQECIPVRCILPAHNCMGSHSQRPPDRDLPGQRPPGQRLPLDRDSPWTDPPRQEPNRQTLPLDRDSLDRHPLDRDPLLDRDPPDRNLLDRDSPFLGFFQVFNL